MTKPWRLKTNSSNILLILITLMLVEAECKTSWTDFRGHRNNLEDVPENLESVRKRVLIIGNDEISRYYFESSNANGSLLLNNLNRCLDNFQLITCLKLYLLDQINAAESALRSPEMAREDINFFRGLVSFKRRNEYNERKEENLSEKSCEVETLDEEISEGVRKLFRHRTLRVNFSSRYVIDIAPIPKSDEKGFVCFGYEVHKKPETDMEDSSDSTWKGRKKKGKGGMSLMMIPQLIMLGFLPFTLASLKALVMNAVMVNMMALNGAIFMTIRNLVFGPRSGSNVQYVNYGYSKDRQIQKKRPVLIIHSAAAFVKQPVYHRRTTYHPTYIPHQEFREQKIYGQEDQMEETEGRSEEKRNDREFDFPYHSEGGESAEEMAKSANRLNWKRKDGRAPGEETAKRRRILVGRVNRRRQHYYSG